MKLINIQNQQPVVEFIGDQIIFYNRFLEKEMQTLGILIPHGLRSVFQGKDCIYLGEEQFQKAFREIYCVTALDPAHFQWLD
jgi:hypothetical protein